MLVLPLQLRDLRLLDPQLATSYPSAILARETAMVLNLEFVKVFSCQLFVMPILQVLAAGLPWCPSPAFVAKPSEDSSKQ